MEDDDYAYDEDRYCLRGRKTGHEYSMGDKVEVKVLAVLLEKQRANFILENQ